MARYRAPFIEVQACGPKTFLRLEIHSEALGSLPPFKTWIRKRAGALGTPTAGGDR
jgi:hypothetical protein